MVWTNEFELERIDGSDVHQVEHLAQHREPYPVPEEPRDLLAHPDRSQVNVLTETHRGCDRRIARLFAGDDFDKDDQLRLYRMDNNRPFGVGHIRGESAHRKVGCRAPHEHIGADRRLDIPIAGRFCLGVFDDQLHHGSAGC